MLTKCPVYTEHQLEKHKVDIHLTLTGRYGVSLSPSPAIAPGCVLWYGHTGHTRTQSLTNYIVDRLQLHEKILAQLGVVT